MGEKKELKRYIYKKIDQYSSRLLDEELSSNEIVVIRETLCVLKTIQQICIDRNRF